MRSIEWVKWQRRPTWGIMLSIGRGMLGLSWTSYISSSSYQIAALWYADEKVRSTPDPRYNDIEYYLNCEFSNRP
jgi:hypothetical protein